MIMVLENTTKEREKKYLEELTTKSCTLNMLSSELEQWAITIVYLTSQLHATKKKLMSSSGTLDSSPSGRPAMSNYKPASSKDKLPETLQRRMKMCLSTPLNHEFEEAYRIGSDSCKLLLREPVDAVPDPTPVFTGQGNCQDALYQREAFSHSAYSFGTHFCRAAQPRRKKQHKDPRWCGPSNPPHHSALGSARG